MYSTFCSIFDKQTNKNNVMNTQAKNIKAGDIILIHGIKVKVLSTGHTEGSNFISVHNQRVEKSLFRTRRNYDFSYDTIPVDAVVETF